MLSWLEMSVPAPAAAPVRARKAAPVRQSQIVHESAAPTPGKTNVVVTMERTSTGGTRREAQFKRAAAGAMTPAERASKKRAKAELFPPRAVQLREADAARKRDAVAARKAEAAAVQSTQEAPAVQQQSTQEAVADVYLDIASMADELDGTTAVGKTADEWRKLADELLAGRPLQQPELMLKQAEDAWYAAREKMVEEREAAEQRGEGWWRDLWWSEFVCDAWRGPLPPYMSTVCACCKHEPVLGGRNYDGTYIHEE